MRNIIIKNPINLTKPCLILSIKQKDIKILWGRSGNRCAICRTLLTQDKEAVNGSITFGEQAHIIGEKENAPRGSSSLTLEERNSYHNLILLCPNHHTEIDNKEEDWPVERLYQIKSKHELWVTETLSETSNHVEIAKQAAVSNIIDSAVHLCQLEGWTNWTSFALSADPKWSKSFINDILEFRQRVVATIWPDEFDELKRATQTLSILLHRASQYFLENSREIDGDTLGPDKFYKAGGWNDNYHRDLKKYEEWIDECYALVEEATKAANWFADVVRASVNPMFFLEKGKFLICFADYLSFHTRLLEYSEDEKKDLPESLSFERTLWHERLHERTGRILPPKKPKVGSNSKPSTIFGKQK